jgi:hypothetical protein
MGLLNPKIKYLIENQHIMNKNNENNFAIIASINLGILLIYFMAREKQNEIFFQDAFVIVIQVIANFLLAGIFGTIDSGNAQKTQQNELKETDILDDEGSTIPKKSGHYSRSKSFLLSALLVLLIGFGLCTLTNQ